MTEKIEWYKEVLDLEPNSKIFFPLAKMLEKEGELEEARRVLAEGVSRHEEFLEARLFYISVLSRLGMDAECQRQVRILASLLTRYQEFWSAWSASTSADGRTDASLALRLLRISFARPGVSFSEIFARGLESLEQDMAGDSAIVPEEETAARPEWGPEGTEPAPGADAAEPVSAAEAAPEPVSAPGTEAAGAGEPESADCGKSETASGSESGAGEEPEELVEDEDMDEAAPAGGASSLRTRSYADVLAEQGDYDTALAIYSELAASAAPADREADEKRVAELKRLKQASQAGRQPQNDETVTPETKNDPDPKMISLIDALARRCDARARS